MSTVTWLATSVVSISTLLRTCPTEALAWMICSGSQTGSMGTLISALMMMAFRLSRVRAFARIQENILFPLPGLPQTVMTFPIGNSFPKGGMPLTFCKTNV